MFNGIGNIIHCHSEIWLLPRLHLKDGTMIVCESPPPLIHGLTIPKINFHSILRENGHDLIDGENTGVGKLTPDIINGHLKIIRELFTQFKTVHDFLRGGLSHSDLFRSPYNTPFCDPCQWGLCHLSFCPLKPPDLHLMKYISKRLNEVTP